MRMFVFIKQTFVVLVRHFLLLTEVCCVVLTVEESKKDKVLVNFMLNFYSGTLVGFKFVYCLSFIRGTI